MKFHTTITEDSITPYLNDIENRLNASREEIIRTIGEKFATDAAASAADWTGNLSQSIDDPDNWHLTDNDMFIQLDIVFTGLSDGFDEWWDEFRDESSPYGGRDYAYYQETGRDIKASYDDAREKWYVKRNEAPAQRFANKVLKEEIRRIMKL